MAYTIYKTAEFSGGLHSGRIAVEVDSQSISGNYSIINIKLQVREDTNASSYNNGGASVYIAVDGDTKVTDDVIDFRGFSTGTWYTILSKTSIKVYHNTDGSKEVDVKGYCATGVGAGTYNQTAAVTLPKIPRKSSISSLTESVIVDGSNAAVVNISRASSSFYHTVKFSIGAYTQSYTNVDTSASFTVPMSWLNAIPNDVSGTVICRVTTYDADGNNLGYVEDTFTISVPDSVIPVVSGIAFNRYATGDPFSYYVQGISKVQVTGSTVSNQYGASTATYYWYITPSMSSLPASYRDATFVSAVLGYSGTMYVALRVRDSRGRLSGLYYQAITVYPYVAPSITLTSERCDSAGNTDANGEYINIKLKSVVASVNSNNTAAYVLKYKKTTDSTWTTIDMSGYANNFALDVSFIKSASSSNSWEVQAAVTDKVGSVTKTAQVSTAKVIMDFLAGGLGISIGKVAEFPGLEIAWELFGAGLNLTQIPFSYSSTAAAATADKGSFDGHVFLDQIIDVLFSNGNTAASPTITIGSVTYTITGLPTVAKLSTSAYQSYKLKKTGTSTLTFVDSPGYITESGVSGVWTYRRMSNRTAECWGTPTGISIASTGAFGTGGLYNHTGTFALPAGLFSATPNSVLGSMGSSAASYGAAGCYPISATSAGIQVLRNTSSSSTTYCSAHALGTW